MEGPFWNRLSFAPKELQYGQQQMEQLLKRLTQESNGNYVKIRHNSTYSTQYLHMSKIKKGITRGVYVKQGECIGYVGSTGLATGPHVCYRFGKTANR